MCGLSKLGKVANHPVPAGHFPASVRSATPFPTRAVARPIRTMAAVFLEPAGQIFGPWLPAQKLSLAHQTTPRNARGTPPAKPSKHALK